MTDKNKLFQQASRKKQMRLECKHTLETALESIFVSQVESQSNEENFHIFGDLALNQFLNMSQDILVPVYPITVGVLY